MVIDLKLLISSLYHFASKIKCTSNYTSMVLLTQTVSLLRKPVTAPVPYLMEKLVPFFVYVDDLELSYLSCVPVNNETHFINCNQYNHSLSSVKTHGKAALVQEVAACTYLQANTITTASNICISTAAWTR